MKAEIREFTNLLGRKMYRVFWTAKDGRERHILRAVPTREQARRQKRLLEIDLANI